MESERWKQAEVPPEFQSLVTYVFENNTFPPNPFKVDDKVKDKVKKDNVQHFIMVGDEKYAVVSTALMLIQMIHEYCR